MKTTLSTLNPAKTVLKIFVLLLALASSLSCALADVLLLEESFEENGKGKYPPAEGWKIVQDSPGGYLQPQVLTNSYFVAAHTGTNVVTYGFYSRSLWTPEIDVEKFDEVVLSFYLKQVAGRSYRGAQGQDWQNDSYCVGVSFDGAETCDVYRDYAAIDGYVGKYTGELVTTEAGSAVADGEWKYHEIKFNVSGISKVKFRLVWKTIDKWEEGKDGKPDTGIDKTFLTDRGRQCYMDTVKVVGLPNSTMMIIR